MGHPLRSVPPFDPAGQEPDDDMAESTQQRLAQLEATLAAHFASEEEDKARRREDRLELNEELHRLSDELAELRNLLRVAKLSGKALIGVATVVGGLIAWIVNLLLAHNGH